MGSLTLLAGPDRLTGYQRSDWEGFSSEGVSGVELGFLRGLGLPDMLPIDWPGCKEATEPTCPKYQLLQQLLHS